MQCSDAHALGGERCTQANDGGPEIKRMAREPIRPRARHLTPFLQVPCRPDTQYFPGRSDCSADRHRTERRP